MQIIFKQKASIRTLAVERFLGQESLCHHFIEIFLEALDCSERPERREFDVSLKENQFCFDNRPAKGPDYV